MTSSNSISKNDLFCNILQKRDHLRNIFMLMPTDDWVS